MTNGMTIKQYQKGISLNELSIKRNEYKDEKTKVGKIAHRH